MSFILMIVFCVSNFFNAKKNGLPAGKWVLYTFLAVMAASFIGAVITSIIFVIRDPHLRAMMLQSQQDQASLMQYFSTQDMFFPELFMLFCGLGGYLFTRHLIFKKAKNTR